MKYYKILFILLTPLTVLTGCKNENSDKNQIAEAELPSSPYIVDIEAIDYAFKMQSEVKSGWVTFDFENRGHKMHFGMLLKFNKPIDKKDLDRYYEDRTDENFQKLMGEEGLTIVGGPGFHTQGQRSEMSIYLEPGDYLMSCGTETVDGTPHYELGMEKFFKVTGENSESKEPAADLEVFLTKYIIEAKGELREGKQTIAVNHAGGDLFDVHLVKLNDTSRIESAIKFMDKVQSPSKVIFETGVEQSKKGSVSYISLDLEPGNYAWVSHEYGAMGMVKEFSIPEGGVSEKFTQSNRDPLHIDIELAGDNIRLPSVIEAGPATFTLKDKNSGEEHNLMMFRMEEGNTAEDFVKFSKEQKKALEEKNEDFDMENPTSGDYVSFDESDGNLELNLDPGTYGIACLHQDDDGNFEHLFEGEIARLEVK